MPELAQLEYLNCSGDFQTADLRAVLASDHLTGLRELRAHGLLDRTVTELLAGRANFRTLTTLILDWAPAGHRPDVEAQIHGLLGPGSALAGLEELQLFRLPLQPDAAIRVAPVIRAPGLRRLRVTFTPLAGRGLTALLSAPGLAGLTHVALTTAYPGDPIDWSAAPAGLESISLDRTQLGEGNVRGLTWARHLRKLTALGVGACDIDADQAGVLARWPGLATVRHLNLQRNQIRDAGAVALAGSPHLEHVERVCVAGNLIRKPGRDALKARFGRRCVVTEAPPGIWSG